MPTTLSGLARGIADSVSWPFFVVGILLIAAIIGFVCYRTRSLLPITLGIWRVVMRRAPGPDRTLQEALNQRISLIWFLFFFRIPVRTIGQAKAVIRWCRLNDEEPSSIAACTPEFFDIETCEFLKEKIPSFKWILGRFFIALASLLLAILIVVFGLVPRAVVKFNESGQWMTLSKTAAYSLDGRFALDANGCKSLGGNGRAGLNASESEVVCGYISSGALAAYVETTVAQQRWTSSVLAVPLMFASLHILRWFWSAANAADIRGRLDRRQKRLANKRKPRSSGKPNNESTDSMI
jgi:hypothetical protein